MAITQNDLEILKSEIMADTPDGGGLPTGIAVIDGVSNNLFPDVSDIDRLEGRVRLRKVFPSVKTANTDLLQASRLLLTEIPSNPNMSVFMFAATGFADRRTDAVEYMNSYKTATRDIAIKYLGKQVKGSKTLALSSDNLVIRSITVGDIILLSQISGVGIRYQQFVKVTAITVSDPPVGTSVQSIDISISEPLRYDFGTVGSDDVGTVFLTELSGDLKIYSASKIAAPIINGATSIELISSDVRIAPSGVALDSKKVGIDLLRLPEDGLIKFVAAGDLIAITELKTMDLPTNAANDNFNLGFERLSDVNVVDANGLKVSSDYLDIDLDAGTLKLNGMFDMSFYTAPLTAKYRIMDLAKVATVSANTVTLSNPITHNYTTAAIFSSMLLAGDMQARAYNVFGQKSWGGVWSDSLIGDATTSQLQVTNNPIMVTNRDAIEERWALVFTGTTSFRIIGETVGEIGTGSTTANTSPLNPMTSQPYFTIPAAAWGTGWSANNVVRINTAAAKYNVWIGNAIQQHQGSSSDNYDFTIGYHANIDRERV